MGRGTLGKRGCVSEEVVLGGGGGLGGELRELGWPEALLPIPQVDMRYVEPATGGKTTIF